MKKIFTLILVLACTIGLQAAETTWTIAGVKALMGVDWNPAAEENLMTTTDGSTFTLVKENVMLKAGSYEYKACQDGAWTVTVPQEGNMELTIEENAEYKVTFTLTEATSETPALMAEAVKTGEYVGPVGDVWIVAGAEELMGSSWNGSDESNQMTPDNSGKIYKLVKTDVPLNVETPYQYKFVKDGSAWYGNLEGVVSKDNGNANFEFYVAEPGKYTVEWTLNTETWTQSIQTTKTGDAEFGEKTWTICGEKDLCGSNWSPEDTSNDMEKVDEGVFELTRPAVELAAKDYEYKVAANHSWSESYGNESGQNQVLTVAAAGTYDVTFSFIVATKTLDALYEETTGIQAVTVKMVPSAAIYNLQGQRVNGNFRGIAIQNGKKMLMK